MENNNRKDNRHTWTLKQDDILRSEYHETSPQELVAKLGHSWTAILKHAQSLGLHRPRTRPSDYAHFRRMPRWQRAWLACALDGEGTIGIGLHHESGRGDGLEPYISVSNTKEAFVARFKELLRTGNGISLMTKHRNETGRAPIYQYGTSRLPLVYSLLNAIKPYLVIKQKQAEIVLEFISIQMQRKTREYSPEQYSMYQEVRRCNQRWRRS